VSDAGAVAAAVVVAVGAADCDEELLLACEPEVVVEGDPQAARPAAAAVARRVGERIGAG
jgi:hypothetical protein